VHERFDPHINIIGNHIFAFQEDTFFHMKKPHFFISIHYILPFEEPTFFPL